VAEEACCGGGTARHLFLKTLRGAPRRASRCVQGLGRGIVVAPPTATEAAALFQRRLVATLGPGVSTLHCSASLVRMQSSRAQRHPTSHLSTIQACCLLPCLPATQSFESRRTRLLEGDDGICFGAECIRTVTQDFTIER